MKKLVLVICTLLCANVLFAQEQLATLKHNGNISVYYGANAFVEAYNAAANGDIITLSDGTFNAPLSGNNPAPIRKGIILRGNGAQPDSVRGTQGTYFLTQIKVQNLGDTASFEAEGIFFQEFRVDVSYDIKLTNCCVEDIRATGCGLQARNCIIKDGYSYSGDNTHPHNFTNCVLCSDNFATGILLPDYSILTNCIIKGHDIDTNRNSSLFNNCIIIIAGNRYRMGETCNNSILCGFNNLPGTTNVAMEVSDVFETWDGSTLSFDPNTYKLKANVANSVLGNDGTQVGIFGGDIPFSFTPSYSVIKRLDVPNRTDENGMLNIDVEFLTE